MIATIAGSEASAGLPRLLIFLTFLSANLAIVNFLPIPALDGGHFLFLLWEGISGKPVNDPLLERLLGLHERAGRAPAEGSQAHGLDCALR